MKKIISILLLFTFGLSGCEKDDICDPTTPTTPRLVISFFDAADATLAKKLTNLKVVGVDKDGKDLPTGIIFNETATDSTKYFTNASTISIPLQTNENVTTYKFIFNAGSTDPNLRNTDIISFNYTHQDSYVSRACGFKTTFVLNPFSNVAPISSPFILDPGTDTAWMRVVNVNLYNIESENETHIEVYF